MEILFIQLSDDVSEWLPDHYLETVFNILSVCTNVLYHPIRMFIFKLINPEHMQICLVNKSKAGILTFLYRGSERHNMYFVSANITHVHAFISIYCKCKTIHHKLQ